MKLRRRNLTLLEVLISFTLIVLCLFPLLSPHVTYYQIQRKQANRILTNLAIANWYASFYEGLLKKERSWDSLPFETEQPIENLPDKAWYMVTIQDDKAGNKETVYLLKIDIRTVSSGNFTYYFVAKRSIDEDQKTTSDSA